MKSLTSRQQQVYFYLQEYMCHQGYPPSVREVSAHLGVKGTATADSHLKALEKKGWLKRHAGGSRTITMLHHTETDTTHQVLSDKTDDHEPMLLPVVGVVRAGVPCPPIEDIESYLSVDQKMARKGACFVLRVQGDSMNGAGVLDGDMAFIKQQPTANNRDMVIALVEGEATMKWFFQETDHIRLQPANPNIDPIIIPSDRNITIIGKVVGIYRPLI